MIGNIVLKLLAPFLEFIAPIIPGEIFPYFFTMEMFQRSLIAALLVTMVAGFLGLFLLMRNPLSSNFIFTYPVYLIIL